MQSQTLKEGEDAVHSKWDGYTGRLLEEEVLGRCTAASRHGSYVPWREALGWVQKNQPNRKTLVALRLEREVGRQLETAVKFFTAVRSPMDVFHGVDAFFVATTCHGQVVATVDLSRNPNKDCGKADLLVHQDELNNLPELAGRIARELTSKLGKGF